MSAMLRLSIAFVCVWQCVCGSQCPAPNDTSTWTMLASTNKRFEARDGHATAVFRGKLWIVGGQSGTYTTRHLIQTTRRSDVWNSYDGDVWTQVIDESEFPRRYGHTLTVFNEKSLNQASIMVLMGGYTPMPANDIWYTVDGSSWTQVSYSVPWTPRGWHCAMALNGYVYVMGGSPLNNEVWYTDSIVSGNWKQMSSVPWSARAGHACTPHTIKNATIGDASAQEIGVVLAGWGNDTQMLNDVWTLDSTNTWSLATSAAPWPVRAFTSVVSMQSHAPSDFLFGPRLWLLGGGRIGHGVFPMYTYSDVWQSRDGVNWIPISSAALGESTAGWCQVSVDGKYTCIGKWGHSVLVTNRSVVTVNVCGQQCRSESNGTALGGCVIPQCDPRDTPSGATVTTTIVNGIYHMSSSFADGCGTCKTARYTKSTTLPALVFIGGSSGGQKVADVFMSTDFFLCENNGHVCSNKGSCTTGGVCICDDLWGGEYCDQLLPVNPSTTPFLHPLTLSIAFVLMAGNKRVVGLVVAAGGLLAFSLPFVIVQKKKDQNTMSMEGPLSTSQVRRGVFMNTGSKDIGRDPDWDLKTNTYKGRRTAYPPREED